MRFANLALRLLGATSGEQIIKTAAAASGAITLPAGTMDFSATGGTSQVVRQSTAGGAFTVGQLAAADVSGVGTGTVTSVAAGTGITVSPSPIVGAGTVSLATPVSVANGGTGLSAGTSGGVPYYSATGTIASSALLTANALIKGAGAGAAPVASTATVDGSGHLHITGSLYTNSNTTVVLQVSGNYTEMYSPNGAVVFTAGNAADPNAYHRSDFHYFFNRANSTQLARLESSGVFVIASANAYKPGGGAWLDSSDARLKKDIVPFRRGLDAVLALQPVRYRHNGRGETKDDGTVYTGLVADDVAEVLPEMVGARRVRMDDRDKDDTEVLTLDATPLIYALVNSVKELAARVAALEARDAPTG